MAYKTLPDLLFHISVSSYFLFLPPADPHSFLTCSSGQFLSHSSSLPHAGLHFLVILPSHFLFLFFSFPLPESLERMHLSPQSLTQSRQCWWCRRMGGVDSGPVIRLPSLSSAPTLLYPTLSVALWGGRVQSMNFCFASGSLLGASNGRCRRETTSLPWGKGLAPSFLWSSCFCQVHPSLISSPQCLCSSSSRWILWAISFSHTWKTSRGRLSKSPASAEQGPLLRGLSALRGSKLLSWKNGIASSLGSLNQTAWRCFFAVATFVIPQSSAFLILQSLINKPWYHTVSAPIASVASVSYLEPEWSVPTLSIQTYTWSCWDLRQDFSSTTGCAKESWGN